MPTENRSSNTEMASEPGAHDLASKVREAMDRQACPNAWMVIAYEAVVKNFPTPPPQPHAEPIAWMVGTAIWWTKEEAERDAAGTGLPIVGLGPMTGIAAAEQNQCTPVGEVVAFGKGLHEIAWAAGRMPGLGAKLYTHVDPGEVERLREDLAKYIARANDFASKMQGAQGEAGALRAQLAERDALLRLVRDGNGYLEEQDWERINAITKHGSGEAIQSQNVSYERLLRDVATELREPSGVGWEDDMASRIDAALARKPS